MWRHTRCCVDVTKPRLQTWPLWRHHLPPGTPGRGTGPSLGRTGVLVWQVRGIRQRSGDHDGSSHWCMAGEPVQGHHHKGWLCFAKCLAASKALSLYQLNFEEIYLPPPTANCFFAELHLPPMWFESQLQIHLSWFIPQIFCLFKNFLRRFSKLFHHQKFSLRCCFQLTCFK